MLQAPTLPIGIRALNGGLSIARSIGFQRSALEEQNLLETAADETGLDDFGSSEFLVGLRILLGSLRDEAQLTPLGKIIARQEILMALQNRLQLIDYHRRYPEIGAGGIHAPIFIIGQGRSGTTIMHELLSLDDRLRVPQTWEVDHPFPPPEKASYDSDARIKQTQQTLDKTDFILPTFKSIHRMGATLPQECVRFTTSEFLSLIFWTNYNVPTYSAWLKNEADMAPAYTYHRRFLQLLQWKHPAEPWVLKSPGHLWSLGELLEIYPDARFIQTHRDPLKMLASLSSLVTHLRKMSSNHVDPLQIAREWAEWNALGLNASAEFRGKGKIDGSRVVDIDFYEFMASPLVAIKSIYEKFGMELASATEARMQEYLSRHSADQHGTHSYTFEDTGLDLEEERERVKPYQDFFSTRIEVKAG
jgi:Sulfotransferase family